MRTNRLDRPAIELVRPPRAFPAQAADAALAVADEALRQPQRLGELRPAQLVGLAQPPQLQVRRRLIRSVRSHAPQCINLFDPVATPRSTNATAWRYGFAMDAWKTWRARAKALKRGKTDAEIAASVSELLGRDVSRPLVNHWLNGTRETSVEELFALCAAIEADPLDVLFGPERAGAQVAEPPARYVSESAGGSAPSAPDSRASGAVADAQRAKSRVFRLKRARLQRRRF